jgi:hypothetical protein
MEAAGSLEIQLLSYKTTRRRIPEDRNIYIRRGNSLKYGLCLV